MIINIKYFCLFQLIAFQENQVTNWMKGKEWGDEEMFYEDMFYEERSRREVSAVCEFHCDSIKESQAINEFNIWRRFCTVLLGIFAHENL